MILGASAARVRGADQLALIEARIKLELKETLSEREKELLVEHGPDPNRMRETGEREQMAH